MAENITEIKNFSQITNARWYPRYHLAPPFGWCNDPNGFCFYKGEYHFFYQHYPYEPQWGPMHWGHAVSKDLAYWKHLPIALKPDQPYEIGGGCFSGSAIEKDGKLYLLYTAHFNRENSNEFAHSQSQCLALSEDGVHFTKFPGNPIINVPELPDIHGDDFRDPKVWKHDGKFYAVIGSRTPDENLGQALLFESDDLIHWTFKNISARTEGNLGRMWECPNFAEIDGQDVLIFSPMELDTSDGKFFNDKQAGVLIGKIDYATGIFEHGDFQHLDKGFDFYAPQIMQTPDGRTIMIGWMATWFFEMPESADGWAGQMTIPRELHIKNGKIFSTPVKELKKLRKWKPVTYKNLLLKESTTLEGVEGDACELLLTIDAAKSKKFSIAVRASDDEKTVISYDAADGTFTLDRTNSGVVFNNILPKEENPITYNLREIKITPTNKLKLHIFIDRSSVEIFINDGAEVLSAKMYPQRTSQKIIFTPLDEVFAIKNVTLHKLDFGVPHPHIKSDPVNLKAEFPFLK